MSGLRFSLHTPPVLRLDLRALQPAALAESAAADIARLPVPYGKALVPLGEFFRIEAAEGEDWVFDGDLSRCDRLGWQLAAGRFVVEGSVGDYVGAGMTGGEIRVRGSARDLAACEMTGGSLTIEGSVGDFAASTLPGSMDGMRGGRLIVQGDAGERFADRMRRGTAAVFGNVGEFAASRLVAGTVLIGAAAGAHVGYGMRRGSVVFAGSAPAVPPTFVPALVDAAVFWQLLSRDLARLGGPFAKLPSRRIERHLGDVSAAGKGELIFAG